MHHPRRRRCYVPSTQGVTHKAHTIKRAVGGWRSEPVPATMTARKEGIPEAEATSTSILQKLVRRVAGWHQAFTLDEIAGAVKIVIGLGGIRSRSRIDDPLARRLLFKVRPTSRTRKCVKPPHSCCFRDYFAQLGLP